MSDYAIRMALHPIVSYRFVLVSISVLALVHDHMVKFLVSMSDEMFQLLSETARGRGVKVQELIRAVIVPDWFNTSIGTSDVDVASVN